MKNKVLFPGIISLALLASTLTSCEDEKPMSELIIGKWEVQKEQQIFLLQNVKKFEYTFYYEADELAFEFTTGGGIIIYQDGEIFGMSTFTLIGNKVVIEQGDNDVEWEEISTDGNTMTWKESLTEVIDEETYNIDIIYTAQKSE